MVYLRSQATAKREIAAASATECHFFKVPIELRTEIYKYTLSGTTNELKKLKRPVLLNICQRTRVESLVIYQQQIHGAIEELSVVRQEMWEAYTAFKPQQKGRFAALMRHSKARGDHERGKTAAKRELAWIEEELKKED